MVGSRPIATNVSETTGGGHRERSDTDRLHRFEPAASDTIQAQRTLGTPRLLTIHWDSHNPGSLRRGSPPVVRAILRPIAADRHHAPSRRSVLRAIEERVPALPAALQARPLAGELGLV